MSNANNKMRSKEIYNNRLIYTIQGENTKDTYFNEGLMVGKISFFDRAIAPKTSLIENIKYSATNTPVKALNFVRLAFDSMSARFDRGVEEGKISNAFSVPGVKNPLLELKAYAGYEDPIQQYISYFNLFVSDFKTKLEAFPMKRKILVFEDYVREFLNTYYHTGDDPPLFYREYLMSRYSNQLNSGLIVEIHNGPYDDDSYKIERFYANVNMNYYLSITKRFGFVVDKNIPWRLIADINSPQMKFYMYRTNPNLLNTTTLNTLNIIPSFYDNPEDFIFFTRLLEAAYNDFVSREPIVKLMEPTKCGTFKEIIQLRDSINYLGLPVQTTLKLLEYYISFKDKFYRLDLGNPEKTRLRTTIAEYLSLNRLDLAIEYINSKLCTNDNFEGSINYNWTRSNFNASDIELNVSKQIARSFKVKKFK